ncbi:hypothetical protein CRUP_020352 [Coryphaenoides rupestris]|nr:hypothetical protein CRUP_020352 [Coryphaenoides rupestris]
MSSSIKRRHSNKQGLQNLIRYEEEVNPPQCRLVMEEDEGFSDWTQRLENRKESLLRQEHSHRDLDLVEGEGAGAFWSLDEAYQTHRDRGDWEVGKLKHCMEEEQQDMAELHYSLEERCRLQELEVEHSRPQQEVRFNLIEVIKVGVADLINQWVKGSQDGTRSKFPTKPAFLEPCIVFARLGEQGRRILLGEVRLKPLEITMKICEGPFGV